MLFLTFRRFVTDTSLNISKRALTQQELEIIAENIDVDDEEGFSDFRSDDSVGDTEWNPDSESDDDEPINNQIQNLLLEEELQNNSHVDELPTEEAIGEERTGQTDIPRWTEYEGRHKNFIFHVPSGFQTNISANISPLDAYNYIIDYEVINLIVVETNRFAHQTISKGNLPGYINGKIQTLKKSQNL